MTHCPHCEEDMEVSNDDTVLVDDFFTADADGSLSGREHVQRECPNCDALLGSLAVGAGTGG